ncbi:hypothetical protein [Bacillus subtilis]|uniref:hypothetical protein n=1 Tax=Bacillus subtilis TaxID=1423 RepID=UPI00216666D6|nr:hypothetical protein [Bacillus subtilis]MEC0451488.1 hypothetical protein [Bacillus subtilis]MEC0453273.1 hypothetical protein [Bacillus subtilis]MEC0498660.1 hypothetical protein [Bacillus subtilis]UVW12345.1 hypothetical protein NX823_14650 [Bacillus subtilis]
MFLLDNVLIILVVMALFFLIFTFLNIYTFGKDFLTSVYLTFIFLDLFFKMPLKAVNSVYGEREKLLEALDNDNKLTDEQKNKIRHILEKRSRLFITLYKAGEFSYTELMISLTEWFKNRPFKVKLVRTSAAKNRKKKYETKYLSEKKKDLICLEA